MQRRVSIGWQLAFTILLTGAGVSCGHLPYQEAGRVVGVSCGNPEGSGNLEGAGETGRGVALRPSFRGARLDAWVHDDSDEDFRVDRFRLTSYCDALGEFVEVEGETFLPRSSLAEGGQPVPLIAVSPILGGAKGGYLECRIFGRIAAREGWASFFFFQEKTLLKPFQHATDFERILRSWSRCMIRCTDKLLARYPLDPNRLGTFGISLGGIRNVGLIAAEPRFRANVVMIAGADMASVFAQSQEHLVLRYLARRTEVAGVEAPRIYRDFKTQFVSDPGALAPEIDPESVLLFLARWDDKVPIKNGWELYHAMGRPECRTSPLGHYTSILVLPWAIRHSTGFFHRRFGAVSATDLALDAEAR